MKTKIAALVWFAWVAFFVFATRHIFAWHLDYFHSPGPQFYRIAVIAIPALGCSSGIYAFLRRYGIWRYEPLLFVAIVSLAYLRYEPRALFVAFALLLACSAAGLRMLRVFELKTEDPADGILFGFAAGASLLILFLFALGLMRLFYPGVFLALLAAVAMLGDWRRVIENFQALYRRWTSCQALRHPVAGVAIWFAWIAAACSLMMLLTPVIAFDPVATHLPSVQYYASIHALRPVPGIDYSYFPQGFELLWTLGYSLAGPAAAGAVSGTFFLVFLLILAQLARRCGLNAPSSVVAALFAATLPFLHWTGSVAKNDLGMGVFEGAALLAILRWLETRNFRWILAACFLFAMSFHLKYVAVFAAPPLILAFAWAAVQQPPRWRRLLLAGTVFAGFAVLWPVRAYILTGNPAAPEHMERATGGTVDPIENDSRAARVRHYVELPWSVLFEGDNLAFESPLKNPAGILFVAFAPLALITGRIRPRSPAQILCFMFVAMFLAYWAWVLEVVRYAILPIALCAIPIAALVMHFFDRGGWFTRATVLGLTAYCLLVGMMGMMIISVNGPQIRYLAGKLTAGQYLREAMQAYGAVEFLHHTPNPHAPVFGIKNLARAYAPDPYVFGGMWCAFQKPCRTERIVARTRASGAEYLIVPEDGSVSSQALEQLGSPPRVYQDPYFSVYHLSP